ncbi:HEAT repeat domain-containing protein [Streptomyces sp. Ru72]|uniref:HEAT repeat domain-containing protein n=1 Tax=Streptomyces sp. Ru72 TaxID=2080747 RepID=UPI000D1CF3D2|nr:HEAT repeat domain-containing protein [Streptomyces sp. Ru72]
MTSGLERALAEASSPSWTQRVRAGRDLASFADVPEAAEALVGLLLDAEDTAVTRQTAKALARVGTVAAIRLIALAVAEADDNRADWLQAGVHDALVGPDGAPDIAAACGKLARDPEEAVRRGAADISVWTGDTRC